jgi:hypothetical protein
MKSNNILIYSSVMILLVFISAQMKNFESAGQSDVDSFDIATVGDIGCRRGETISSIDSTSPDVVLFLGDLSYVDQFDEWNDNDDIKCFFDDTSSLTNESKVLIALGSHDIGQKYVTETTKRMLVAHFDIPVKGYYSQIFDHGRILVLVMNYIGLPINIETMRLKDQISITLLKRL